MGIDICTWGAPVIITPGWLTIKVLCDCTYPTPGDGNESWGLGFTNEPIAGLGVDRIAGEGVVNSGCCAMGCGMNKGGPADVGWGCGNCCCS